MRFSRAWWPAAVLLVLSMLAPAYGQQADDGDEESEETPKSIADITANSDRFDGLFVLYRDRNTGESYLLLRPDQLDREYIYFAVSRDGVPQGGHFRGSFRANRVISVSRYFNRIELRFENTAFYFDPASPLRRAASANISPALLASEEIVAENDETGEVLISADAIFLNESLLQVKETPDPDEGPKDSFRLGELSEDKSRITSIRSYPLNTDVQVEYVYDNPAPVVAGDEEITDSRYVSIPVQHSFIALPENDYRPRFTDHRLGYFAEQVTDLTDDSPTPYHDLVQRWHLVKRNPGAELSEPVEPIVWWIENTTPLEFRDSIREGVLAWNSAFEKIGFRNAIEVRVQPDDAEWEAEDIRYNVLRWASSPSPLFSGYGPSFTNPRTGQILGADIMLEYAGVIRRLQYQRILDNLEQADAPESFRAGYCSFARDLQVSQLFGRYAVAALELGSELEEQVLHEFLVDLVLHEVGHTLGFAHNFAGSRMLALDEVFDPQAVDRSGLYATVMDYTDINVPPPGREHTRFFSAGPGPYDDWLVEYSYSEGLSDPEAERQRLAEIAARSTEPALLFGTDDHNMRAPGWAIDPRIQSYDMSSDPIGYAVERIGLIEGLFGKALEHHAAPGQTFHELRDAYVVMLAQFARSANVLARHVGGVYVNRSVVGQADAQTPFEPVSLDDQRRAMKTIADHLFAPGALAAPTELYNHLQEQRRLWNFWGETEDPKIHEWVLAIQRNALNHFLHPRVMTRITDSRLYGNEYTLAEMIQDLTDAIFEEDSRGDVRSFRQNLQTEYVSRLIDIREDAENEYDYPSEAIALFQLQNIERMLDRKRGGNVETRAHTRNLLYMIERLLEGDI